MLGELNASHTGSGYRPDAKDGDETAALGLLYDRRWNGAGLRIAEVLEDGPADRADSRIAPGVILKKIGGALLSPDVNPFEFLNRKEGKPVRLTLVG